MDNSNFIEIQQFRQGWLLAIVLVPCISALIYIGFKVFRNWPMSGTNMLIYGAIALALVLVPVFMLSIKMVTEVKNGAIHIRFSPLKRDNSILRNCKMRCQTVQPNQRIWRMGDSIWN